MFRFASPEMFWLLLLIPAMAGIYMLTQRSRRKRLQAFGDSTTLRQLIPDSSPSRIRNKFLLFVTAIGLIVIALARPQFGSKLKEVTQEGIEIMLVVDVSNSMLASDLEPNRLERTKFAINRMLESMQQDKVGLIVFAGDAYVQLPITSDYTAARNFVRHVSPNMVTKQGTAIGAAINLAAASFSSDSEGSRVIVLISDGENHEDDPMAAAEAAEKMGIKIYAIGVGTPEGTLLEINGRIMTDNEGKNVLTKLDEETLEKIALSTGGSYIRATNRSIGLTEIIEDIDKTQKKEFTAQIFDEFNEQYQYFLAAAILLLLANTLMLSRKNSILARFNIFRRDGKL